MERFSQAELLPVSNFRLPFQAWKIKIKLWWEQICRPGAKTRASVCFPTPSQTKPEWQQQPQTRWNAQHLPSQRDQKTQSDSGKSMRQQRETAGQPPFIFASVRLFGSTKCRLGNKCDRWEDEIAFKSFTTLLWREKKKKTLSNKAEACPRGVEERKVG